MKKRKEGIIKERDEGGRRRMKETFKERDEGQIM